MTETRKIESTIDMPGIKIPPKITINFPIGAGLPKRSITPPPVPDTFVAKKKANGTVDGEQMIFVRCDRCNKTLVVKIPRKLVLENEEEIVPVSIVHGSNGNKHVLTVYLDPDFRSRRDKVSDVLFVEN
ncbi:MAG TPA: hypothetical protein VKM55_25405 [Candidatus Lokiarchaeia archaeon]|nr:hypothetical protein [Candidatus Lokiarchaeia archaeon]